MKKTEHSGYFNRVKIDPVWLGSHSKSSFLYAHAGVLRLDS